MNTFKQSIIKEVQELQKLGICRDHDMVEKIINTDLTEYENMSVTAAADLLRDLL